MTLEQNIERGLEQGPVITRVVDGSAPPVRLWDNLVREWVDLPVNFDAMRRQDGSKSSQASAYFMQKVAFVCSDCGDASVFPSNARMHVQNARGQFRQHEEAAVTTQLGEKGQSVQICTGCGATFPMRKNIAQRHIDRIREIGAHTAASSTQVQRYSLAPSEVAPPRAEVPEASQETRSRSRRRKRRRH